MIDTADTPRPVPRWLHAWAILTACVTVVLLVLGQLVTTFRAGMADPVWPTEPWYFANNYRSFKVDFGYFVEHTHRIAGFLVGGVVSVLALGLWLTQPRKNVRLAGLLALVALLMAFAEFHRALMLQRDKQPTEVAWPVGAMAVMATALLAVLGIAISGVVSRTRGAGVRLLGVIALVAVMVQGLLGGLRVLMNALVGTDLAAVHGVFAQVVFSVLVAVAVLTGRGPTTELAQGVRQRVGGGTVLLVVLLFTQLIWGALVRHDPTPLTQRMHFMTAFLVVAVVVWLLMVGFSNPAVRSRTRVAGLLLAGFVTLQVALGVEAWMGKFGRYVLPVTEKKIEQDQATIRTLHTLIGTGILATAVAMSVQVWRRVGSGEKEGPGVDASSNTYDDTRSVGASDTGEST